PAPDEPPAARRTPDSPTRSAGGSPARPLVVAGGSIADEGRRTNDEGRFVAHSCSAVRVSALGPSSFVLRPLSCPGVGARRGAGSRVVGGVMTLILGPDDTRGLISMAEAVEDTEIAF